METRRAFHFLRADRTAGSGDEPAWTVGETRHMQGRLELCRRGYHWGATWLDALHYAPGPVACLVEVSVEQDAELFDGHKGVSRTRRLIAAVDASRELRLFAADCAERPLGQVANPDPRSVAAIAAVRAFARGEITSDQLDAAATAAWAASSDADASYAAASAWATASYAAASAWATAAYAAASAWAAAAYAAATATKAAHAAAAHAAKAAADSWKAECEWQAERLVFYLDPLMEKGETN